MTRAASADNGDDEQLKEALAVLISSTRSKRRPLPMTEIARWLEVAVESSEPIRLSVHASDSRRKCCANSRRLASWHLR